ncbi:MAG: twin-arginine translocase subunit TatC [Bacteroidales bacterium]|nr:twin-arginine translocase subunit TatC [Bacteroidales bacterium]
MPEDKELSFWDHLDVLRHLLMRVVVVWLVFGIGYFILMPEIFDKVILAPCYDNFVFYDLLKYIGTSLGFTGDFFTKEFTVHLININMAAQFFTHLSTAFWLSVVTAVPYLIYEAWRFIAPALYKEEKRGVRKAFLLGTVMFFIGVAVGYFMVFPLTLRFLATYELSGAIENQISLNSYIDIFMMLILCIGLSFELPLVTWILSLIGLLNRKTMREYRRHSVIVIFILAAIITPTGDPFTLSVVAIPLCLLYEMSIYLMKK